MRIRWTTRIAMAAGLVTLIAGIMAGGAHVSAAPAGPSVTTSIVQATGAH
jgi:hypothetical protein